MARKRWLGSAIAVLAAQSIYAVSATGCGGSAGAEVGCPALPACGGNPVGTWEVQTFCQYVPPITYSVPSPRGVPTTPLAQTPTAQAAAKSPGDECFDLVYEPQPLGATGNIKLVNLPHIQGEVVNGPVVLSQDGFYSVAVQTLSNNTVHFAPTCLTAYGANPSCSDLASALATYNNMPNYLQRNPPFACTVGTCCSRCAGG